MTQAEWDKFIRNGVVHALAISGQHLMILAVVLWWLLRRFGVAAAARGHSRRRLLVGVCAAGGRTAAGPAPPSRSAPPAARWRCGGARCRPTCSPCHGWPSPCSIRRIFSRRDVSYRFCRWRACAGARGRGSSANPMNCNGSSTKRGRRGCAGSAGWAVSSLKAILYADCMRHRSRHWPRRTITLFRPSAYFSGRRWCCLRPSPWSPAFCCLPRRLSPLATAVISPIVYLQSGGMPSFWLTSATAGRSRASTSATCRNGGCGYFTSLY